MRNDGVVARDELDELYEVRPEEFTALRTDLAEAAKRRGETDLAKRISAARKPTTAAWIVNRLALTHPRAKQRLTDLGERLRAAHAAMAGDSIRALTTEQRHLINELARTAFQEAGVTNPSAPLRDDVTDTLQAAIADSEVSARLGRLTKAERWSGFGEFGDAAQVFTQPRQGRAEAKQNGTRQTRASQESRDGELTAARQRREKARATLAAAERAKSEADDQLADRQADLGAARLRHDDARKRLQEAERILRAAENAYQDAKQASRDAAEVVKAAKARLK